MDALRTITVEAFPLISIVGVLLGWLIHAGKQLITARRTPGPPIDAYEYIVGHWPEAMFAALCSTALYLAVPEFASYFPDFARILGFGIERTFLSGLVCGFVGNSFADFLGGRAKAIAGIRDA